ncbi:MAG TPA: hypothetical protein VE078_11925 [Thermoanaerobaculia bacterium]|nr:hypothetical protein [Thermoanaerobaculia bacterium]
MPEKMDPSAVVWDWRAERNDKNDALRRNAAARRRSLIGLAVGLLIAAALYFLWKPVVAYVVAAVSLALGLLAFVAPQAYLKVTGLLDRFAHAVGMAVTWLLMTLLYYFLFLPVGLFLRLRGRLGITQHPDQRLPSYWSSAEKRAWTAESYRKQF